MEGFVNINVSGGGYACNVTVRNGNYLTVENGLVSKVTVLSTEKTSAEFSVCSGGTASDVIVGSGCEAKLNVHAGGSAVNVVLNGYQGHQSYINCSGGTLVSASVDSLCFISAHHGANVNYAVLNHGGWMDTFLDETHVNHTEVKSGGKLIVSYGLVENTVVSSGGIMTCRKGNSIKNVMIESGGYLYANDGGCTITGLSAETGANLFIDVRYKSWRMNISGTSGGSGFIIKTVVSSGFSGGSQYVVSRQEANVKNINSGCRLHLIHGGYAEYTAVDNGGELYLGWDADVYNIDVNSGGTMTLYQTGRDSGVLQRGRNVRVNSGGYFYVGRGSAYDLQVNSGGVVKFGSGGYSEDIHAAEGAALLMTVGSYTYIQGTSNGFAFEMKDALLSNYIANSSGGVYVERGAKVLDTSIEKTAFVYISSGGSAENLTIESGGSLIVAAGGSASGVEIKDGALLNLTVASQTVVHGSSGGTALDIAENQLSNFNISSGTLTLANGAKVINTGVCSGGKIILEDHTVCSSATIDAGGLIQLTRKYAYCYYAIVNSGGSIENQDGTIYHAQIRNGGKIYLDGGAVSDTEVYSGGEIKMNEADRAYNISAHSGAEIAGYTLTEDHLFKYISGGIHERLDNAIVRSGASAFVDWDGIVCNTRIESGGFLQVNTSSGSICGKLDIADGGKVIVAGGTVIEFSVNSQSPEDSALISNWSLIENGTNAVYTIVIAPEQKNGTYLLAGEATDFTNTITIKNTNDTVLGKISVNGELIAKNQTFALVRDDSTLKLTVSANPPANLAGDGNGISWSGSAESYVAEYSTDDYTHTLRVTTTQTAVDTYGMPAGTYDWRVRNADSGTWVNGNSITAQQGESPQKLESDNDGCGDIFFGNADGTWESKYATQHVGDGTWAGTGEIVQLAGKNKITDVFVGSDDANLLVLTDDANGDAVALDDIYSAFPDEVQQARVAQIDEIRAGAGDDVVDMTSQRFTYLGHGVTIRGGDGDDTIWANLGDNKLFGDAGDDRIVGASGDDVIAGGAGNDMLHGGGGNDIFCFCKDWGTDTVEQLSDGTVTLWFESNTGSWDQSEMTYTDGDNTVKVSGVSDVTIKYADDSEEYKSLAGQGAFMKKSSEKIFEEESRGVLAVL